MRNLLFALLPLLFVASSCSDPCGDIACLNGGGCQDGNCICPEGFSGENCQIADPCTDVVCLNGGGCQDGTCICPEGFVGENCQTPDPCNDVLCLNGGTCVDGTCQCDYWYTGDNCETEVRSKHQGTYNGTMEENQITPLFAVDRFDVDITLAEHTEDPKRMRLSDPFLGYDLYVTLSSESTFTFTPRSYSSLLPGTESVDLIEGSGTFDGVQMNYTYDLVFHQTNGSDILITFSYSGIKQ